MWSGACAIPPPRRVARQHGARLGRPAGTRALGRRPPARLPLLTRAAPQVAKLREMQYRYKAL